MRVILLIALSLLPILGIASESLSSDLTFNTPAEVGKRNNVSQVETQLVINDEDQLSEFKQEILLASQKADINMPTGLWERDVFFDIPEAIFRTGTPELKGIKHQSILVKDNGDFIWKIALKKKEKKYFEHAILGNFRVNGSTLIVNGLNGAEGFVLDNDILLVEHLDESKFVFGTGSSRNKVEFYKSGI
jgi:hypothetical protein